MNFIVVTGSNEAIQRLGRQLAHGISLQKGHSASFWTEAHYRENEPTLDGKQPVIFLGKNSLADSYTNVLPERFRGYGTQCYYDGPKAVLCAEAPEDVTNDDIKEIKRAVEENLSDIHRQSASIRSAGKIVSSGAVGITAGYYIWPTVSILTILVEIIVIRMFSAKRRQAYHTIQHEYVLSRFLKDEFETFVHGIETLG